MNRRHFIRLFSRTVTAMGIAVALVACKPPESVSEKTQVVATTTMLADVARELGGDRVTVTSIMKPGGDPHSYQPVPADSRSVARADLVITNGLALEGWLDHLVENAGGDADVVAAAEGIEGLLDDPAYPGNPDPHVWFSVPMWKEAVANVRDGLIDADPEGAAHYRERADAYLAELDELDTWIRAEVERIPEGQRHIVTSHDAFQYLGSTYGFDVMAVQGISTTSEASAAEMRDVIDYVTRHRVPAIFVETSVNPQLIEQVERETGARIGGTLYSDSLGPSDSDAGTYVGMVRSNVSTLSRALGAEREARR